MKKKVFSCFLAVAPVLLISSCSKEEDEPSLVGTWVSKAVNNKIFISSVLTFDSSRSLTGEELVVTFNADKTYTGWSLDESDKETGTYFIDGKNLVLYTIGDFDSLKYTLTKDEFTTINEDYQESDSSKYEIETITYKRR
ncbi:MAG: hypothetical protein V4561_01275 [Bacteroidota bacterium]